MKSSVIFKHKYDMHENGFNMRNGRSRRMSGLYSASMITHTQVSNCSLVENHWLTWFSILTRDIYPTLGNGNTSLSLHKKYKKGVGAYILFLILIKLTT